MRDEIFIIIGQGICFEQESEINFDLSNMTVMRFWLNHSGKWQYNLNIESLGTTYYYAFVATLMSIFTNCCQFDSF